MAYSKDLRERVLGYEEDYRTAHRLNERLDGRAVVRGHVVLDDDLTGLKPGQQGLLDPSLQGIPIHCSVQHHLRTNALSR